jgi:hypothetical protein
VEDANFTWECLSPGARHRPQGDTPSTLIFIAVFDILLTLLDSSGTGLAYAYADNLVHLAPSVEAQQRQVDLMCGFCAFTGLEIFLSKVEAISTNYDRMLHDTPPFLRLRDWQCSAPRWVLDRYLGLYLDKQSCSKQFRAAAKLKLKTLCHLLAHKIAPLAAKRMIYNLCLKSQIRYPAGLAPWTTQQYIELDKIPTALLRQVYGLRRCFPIDLIYVPEEVGGCGETRISDTAQLHKWQYLYSLAHLGSTSSSASTALIRRALAAGPTDPSSYCTSLVKLGE